MREQHEEHESLAGRDQIKIQSSYKISTANSMSGNILTFIMVLVIFTILYHFAQRTFAAVRKQQEMYEMVKLYGEIADNFEQKLLLLKTATGNHITDEDLQKYKQMIKQIDQFQNILRNGQKDNDKNNERMSGEMAKLIQGIQKEIGERIVMIDTLIAHSKEETRKKKIEMIQKIGKKPQFLQEKVRNPWALSRINLKTPFIDTIQHRHMQEQLRKQSERLEQTYHLRQYDDELPLCVVVPTRNNAKNFRFQYNLQSIINQKYQNYKIVVIDDASDDGTGDLIKYFLKTSKFPPDRYFIIQNKERLSAVPNIYNAIKNYCSVDDIVVMVSGDDELLGKLVFKIVNVVYQTKKPGIAYTNHIYGKLHEKDADKGYSRPYTEGQIKAKLYRFIGQKFGHMRTFPVSIFLEIKEQHMKYRDGRWVQATYDETFILPILEMACDSIEYIDQYVYLYNYGTGQNDGEVRHEIQQDSAFYVRQLPRYTCLEKYQKYVM